MVVGVAAADMLVACVLVRQWRGKLTGNAREK